MATQATLEQWEELYDLAIEITKLKPWNAYWDMDLIAVETKKMKNPTSYQLWVKVALAQVSVSIVAWKDIVIFVKSAMTTITYLQHL